MIQLMEERAKTALASNWTVPVWQSTLYASCKSIGVSLSLLLVDYGAIVAAYFTAHALRVYVIPRLIGLVPFDEIAGVYIFVGFPVVFMSLLHFSRMYARRMPFRDQAQKIVKIGIYAVIMLVVFMYFAGEAKQLSRLLMIGFWLFSTVYLITGRYFLKRALLACGVWQIPVLLVGAGKTAELLHSAFERDPGIGYKVVGVIEDDPDPAFTHYPVLGGFSQAEDVIQQRGIRDVLIAAPGLPREELLGLIYRLQVYVDHITFVPDLFGVPVASMELETLFNEKTVLLKVRNNLACFHNRLLKYAFECTVSILGTIVIIPLFCIIAVLIYFDSPGAIIFAHERIGAGGKVFPCYKFRTMVANAQEVLTQHLAENSLACEEWERDFKLRADPRITRVGKFLRKTSLDELPQLINVLRGEMSLVGPRPIVQEEVGKYGEYIYDFHLVRPGITGLWQVSGRNDVDYQERVQMDSWYVRNWSLWLDIVLLLKTIKVVFNRNGAY